MNNEPRTEYLQTLLPAIVLIAIGFAMYGEPYYKQAQRQLLVASVQDLDFLSSDQFKLQYEEKFVDHNDQTCHLFVFSKPSASNGQKETSRIVIADANYRLLISDDQMQHQAFSKAVLLNLNKPVLEIVRHQKGTTDRIYTDRFDVSSSGIRVTQQMNMVPQNRSDETIGKHWKRRNRHRKVYSTTG